MGNLKPVFSFVGSSGSGKTTFIEKLIKELVSRNIRVGAIKHDAHKFEMDKPGKDSYRMKAAGAEVVSIAAKDKMGMMRGFPEQELSLEEIIIRWFGHVDMVITEGYKQSFIPKFEIYRTANGKEPVCLEREELLGVITSDAVDTDREVFDIEDVSGVVDRLIQLSDFTAPQIEITGTEDALFKNAILDITKGASFLSGNKKIKIQVIEE